MSGMCGLYRMTYAIGRMDVDVLVNHFLFSFMINISNNHVFDRFYFILKMYESFAMHTNYICYILGNLYCSNR